MSSNLPNHDDSAGKSTESGEHAGDVALNQQGGGWRFRTIRREKVGKKQTVLKKRFQNKKKRQEKNEKKIKTSKKDHNNCCPTEEINDMIE